MMLKAENVANVAIWAPSNCVAYDSIRCYDSITTQSFWKVYQIYQHRKETDALPFDVEKVTFGWY